MGMRSPRGRDRRRRNRPPRAGARPLSPKTIRPPTVRPVHTYSIVAADRQAGEIGVAVQSHWFSVGSTVPWAEAGVGAVATQAFVNLSFGPRGLALLRQGSSPREAIDSMIATDPAAQMRQLAIIDTRGRAAVHTGKGCIPEAGHIVGETFAVQANMMVSPKVWPAMAEAFRRGSAALAERMLGALCAAQEAGGDLRGQQSAALLVVRSESSGSSWEDRLIDLRVEDHANPLKELGRLLRVFRAYGHMNRGDEALEARDSEGALREYGEALRLYPESEEIRFWSAISRLNSGEEERALSDLSELFRSHPNWRTLLERVHHSRLVRIEETLYRRLAAPKESRP